MKGWILPALAAAALAQASPGSRAGLQPVEFPAASGGLRVWLPEAYEPDKTISRKYTRKPTIAVPDVVSLRLDLRPEKPLEVPPLPMEVDLLKIDPSLSNLKLTPSTIAWRGRTVASVRYEGFVQGKIGVYGRMAWLPLAPGTVVVDLYAEPAWVATMNQDWDLLLASIEGTISERTLRERSPNRWLAAKILAVLGWLLMLAGIIMILARMSEAIGGPIVYLGLVLPLLPLGYGALHLRECWKSLIVFTAGLGLFGVSLLLER